MAKKTKIRDITIVDDEGTFSTFFKRFSGEKDVKEYDFDSLSLVRRLLSNEKAKILHTIKRKSPSSIYNLAKLLGRDFKSVSEDIKLLERFGFIDMISEKTGKRQRLKPILAVDSIVLNIKI
jgi:predicted transcriptional regulator